MRNKSHMYIFVVCNNSPVTSVGMDWINPSNPIKKKKKKKITDCF